MHDQSAVYDFGAFQPPIDFWGLYARERVGSPLARVAERKL